MWEALWRRSGGCGIKPLTSTHRLPHASHVHAGKTKTPDEYSSWGGGLYGGGFGFSRSSTALALYFVPSAKNMSGSLPFHFFQKRLLRLGLLVRASRVKEETRATTWTRITVRNNQIHYCMRQVQSANRGLSRRSAI